MKKTKKSTALVRRRPQHALVRRPLTKPRRALARKPPVDVRSLTLGDDPYIGSLGTVDLTLAPHEELILQRPVSFDDVLVKPTGQPYLSHPIYTRWFNDAFGRLGWNIVPCAKPVAGAPDDKGRITIVQTFLLYIHGKPVRIATGEHDYHQNNAEQTYGDALEALVASALRRCAKRLGVGLELWDKTFLNAFLHERCVKVWVEGENKPRWRRRTDPPFYKERGAVDDDRGAAPVRRETGEPAAAYHSKLDEPITTGPKSQHTRLWTIIGKANRTDTEVHAWLQARYGLKSSKEIPRRLYDEICNWVEQPGPLPPKVIR